MCAVSARGLNPATCIIAESFPRSPVMWSYTARSSLSAASGSTVRIQGTDVPVVRDRGLGGSRSGVRRDHSPRSRVDDELARLRVPRAPQDRDAYPNLYLVQPLLGFHSH